MDESYQLRFSLYAIIHASAITGKHTNTKFKTSPTLYPVWEAGYEAVWRIFQTGSSYRTPRRHSPIPVSKTSRQHNSTAGNYKSTAQDNVNLSTANGQLVNLSVGLINNYTYKSCLKLPPRLKLRLKIPY